MATVDLNSTEEVQNALQNLYNFFQQEYPQFMDEDSHCQSSVQAADQQEAECQADQAGIESSYCSLKAARAQICTDYDACFAEKAALFARVVQDVQRVEEHVKGSYATLSCFSNTVLQDMSSASRPSCNTSEVDTTYLNVFYPSTPSKESCSSVVSTSWNYSANLCDAGAGTTVAPAGPVGTTAAPQAGNASGGNASLFFKEMNKASRQMVAASQHSGTVAKTSSGHHASGHHASSHHASSHHKAA
jgi:hypothetical protein